MPHKTSYQYVFFLLSDFMEKNIDIFSWLFSQPMSRTPLSLTLQWQGHRWVQEGSDFVDLVGHWHCYVLSHQHRWHHCIWLKSIYNAIESWLNGVFLTMKRQKFRQNFARLQTYFRVESVVSEESLRIVFTNSRKSHETVPLTLHHHLVCCT